MEHLAYSPALFSFIIKFHYCNDNAVIVKAEYYISYRQVQQSDWPD